MSETNFKPETAMLISPKGAKCAVQNFAAYEARSIPCSSDAEKEAIETEFGRLRDMCGRCSLANNVVVEECTESTGSFCSLPSEEHGTVRCEHPDKDLFVGTFRNWQHETAEAPIEVVNE